MRPTRLELEGFASFRDPVTVDFADADLFVLSGPTGAGKSSLVDAMTMALYGTVARYDDRRVVAPVISQGRAEARVRLDFTVGSATYSAVRVIRRTKTGATTKEARLERWRDADGEARDTLAGTADEVTAAVEALLGLRFEHFTSCMVLPQGAFQHFLHARPKDRQDLLVQLLDLDVYRRVGQAARDRATALQAEVDAAQRRLDGDLAEATTEALTAADGRVEALQGLLERLDAAQPELDGILDEGRRLREEATLARQRAQLLDGLAPPDDLDQLLDRLGRARQDAEAADTALEEAGQRVEQATQQRQAAGDATPLHQQLDRLRQRDRVRTQLDAAEQQVEQATTAVKDAHERAGPAQQVRDDAQAALEDARQHDLVAAVTAGLDAGDPCPVCDRPIEAVPDAPGAEALDAARQALDEAARAHDTAQQVVQEAERDATRAQAERDGLHRQLVELDEAVADHAEVAPADADELSRRIAAIEQHDAAVAEARQAEQTAREQRRRAVQARDAAEQQRRDAEQVLTATLDRLTELRPPAVDRDDLGAAWQALTDWAARRGPELVAEAERAEAAVADAADRWKQRTAELRRDCTDHDVPVADGQQPRDAAVAALERGRARRDRLAEQVEEAQRLRDRIERERRDQRVATALGQHLRSSNFEKWLLNRALRLLVRGATATLHELSGGAYSLTLDDAGGFAVVDHRNADEQRSARTLSGGETFLASLALALALSEHVADLAAQGAARLESLILDEGFGTLDAETLDVVASALEELGSRGRMIGVITHVQPLAERLPVRYAVRKEAGTSHVERVA